MMLFPRRSVLVVSSLAVVALLSTAPLCARAAEDHLFEWDLDAILNNDFSPDCMNVKDNRRTMFLANHLLPGPVIDVMEGDTITVCVCLFVCTTRSFIPARCSLTPLSLFIVLITSTQVRVTNHHPTEGVSIHWHGIHQRGTPYMDGPSGVTQCALGTLQTQEYVFEAYPPGTHYWHAHGSLHLADGLSGPIVVRPKDPEPFSVDEERIVYLQDWYLQTSTQQLVGLKNLPFTWIGNPNSLLINGKGLAPMCLPGGARFGDATFCLPTLCQANLTDALATVHVDAGKTYRLRIINGGQLVMQNLAIANHTMTIVQVEGTNIDPPITVDSIDVAPGQRYDVLLTTDQVPGTYLMETVVRERNIPGVTGQAILHYMQGEFTNPETSPEHPAWDDTAYGANLEASLLTADPQAHGYEIAALNATNVKRFIMVGTQNCKCVNQSLSFSPGQTCR